MLAQSEEAAFRLRSGLGYDGPVSVGEYPRNYRLLEGMGDQISIRRNLGIPTNERVILYAPTWRNEQRSKSSNKWDKFIESDELAFKTNSFVLLRSHHVAKIRPNKGEAVLDVSQCPHIEDLMAIADILVTDYSSIIYDFSLTGRPIIQHLPDVKQYRSERGLEEGFTKHSCAVTSTQDELIEAINSLTLGSCAIAQPRNVLKSSMDVEMLLTYAAGVARW
nr:CDP-glycerol glycerophosphotransferase family protein [Brevibacterium epidermidis]